MGLRVDLDPEHSVLLSEIDLLLLHWPKSGVPLSEALGGLCAVKQAGLTRHIGVSNFTVADIQEAVRHAGEPLIGRTYS
jgi:diketogulonate reductase-like aldo/keto reductase